MSARWQRHLRSWPGHNGDLARALWRTVSTAIPRLEDPSKAGGLEAGGIQFVWDRYPHHFDVEMLPDGDIDWFYKHRLNNEIDGSGDAEPSLPPRALELLGLFASLVAVPHTRPNDGEGTT